jgi:hypothetical protein
MSSAASIFASHARGEKVIIFECAIDCKVGAYQVSEGDGMKVVSDGNGMFDLHVSWAEGVLWKIDANKVNELAGANVLRCSCLERVGDDPRCVVHSGGGR